MLPPLPVVVPLLAAALVAALSSVLTRRIADTVAFLVASASTVLSAALLIRVSDQQVVYWFGDWRPRHGLAIGISFTVDEMAAGAALLVSVLVTAALAFSWTYFEETVAFRYKILMLVFLGAMNGFALTGDLFNMFVFFSLMSVAAYALTAYRIEETGPLQGALNFAVVTSLGSFGMLLGIALVYGRTGALNFAQIGKSLAGHPTDGLVVAAFTLILVGLFVKCAVVPFHFWLADAHAVAPPTVCVLFSGVMVELGLLQAARLCWPVFGSAIGSHRAVLGHALIGLGVATAIVGSALCFLQRHLKRLLAYSTIAHVGLFLIGLGLFRYTGLAGTAVYVVAHGLVKGALFLLAGILMYRLVSIDEDHLRGRGRELVGTAALFVMGGLALAGVPPFGTFTGKTLIEDAATEAGFHWIPWIFLLVSAITAGAVLRAGGKIFLGWGPHEQSRFGSELVGEREGPEAISRPRNRTPVTQWLPAAVLLSASLILGLVPGLSGHVERAAASFQDSAAYQASVLEGRPAPAPIVDTEPPSSLGIWYGLAAGAGAAALALVSLFRRRLVPVGTRRRMARAFGPPIGQLRALHSGHVGDYAAWFVVGLAVIGGLFILVLI